MTSQEYVALAEKYEESQDFVNALNCYSSALKNQKNNDYLMKKKARCLEVSKNIPEAIKLYEKIISFKSQDKETFLKLASLYQQSQEYAQGFKVLLRYFHLNDSKIEHFSGSPVEDQQSDCSFELVNKVMELGLDLREYHLILLVVVSFFRDV